MAEKKLNRTDEYGAQSRGQTFDYDPDDVTLVTDPSHPLYDPSVHAPPSQKLVDSVVAYGIKEPIVIRRNGTDKDGRAIIEVVDGRDRVKAGRLAKKLLVAAGKPSILIRAVLEKGLRDADAETVMVICNEHRRIEDVVTRAEKLKRYLAHGHNEQQARLAFGMRGYGFKVLMEVMEMGQAVQEALREKKITMEIARTLACLPESKQAKALEDTLQEAGGRGPQAKTAAAKNAGVKLKPKKADGAQVRLKTAKGLLKAIDTVACIPRSDYQTGVLDALEWMLGKKQVSWSGEQK